MAMKSVPGISMRSTPGTKTRILCPKCGECMGVLPPGSRIATAGTPATGRIEGACECGERYSIPTVEDSR